MRKQPEPEPVAWITVKETWFLPKIVLSETQKDGWKPVYISPPQREWVGLTDAEMVDCSAEAYGRHFVLCELIEAKLKEKNT